MIYDCLYCITLDLGGMQNWG
uniref:Uncharacterized protein n=1 Tax=Arundo donax TaxID=35708 RepID=A0A0A9FLQ8_ARUDO